MRPPLYTYTYKYILFRSCSSLTSDIDNANANGSRVEIWRLNARLQTKGRWIGSRRVNCKLRPESLHRDSARAPNANVIQPRSVDAASQPINSRRGTAVISFFHLPLPSRQNFEAKAKSRPSFKKSERNKEVINLCKVVNCASIRGQDRNVAFRRCEEYIRVKWNYR